MRPLTSRSAGREDGGVGDGHERRAIQHDAIVATAQPFEQGLEGGALQELGGIGWDWSRRNDAEVGDDRLEGHVRFRRNVEQRGGQADLVRTPEDAVDARTPKIAVDQHDPLPSLRHGDRDGASDRRLTLRRSGAGYQQRIVGLVRRREENVGADGASCLSRAARRTVEDKQFRRVRLINDLWSPTTRPGLIRRMLSGAASDLWQ
jgi:hypothetical protein